ncbi:MAG: thioredoxin [Clostridiales bacterium]|jgi:thioredoxin 1|nr:thioredoxin [Clostridiales bacterium]
MAIEVLDKNNFDRTINSSPLPVIVDFYADWCAPCKRLAPIIEEVANENTGKVNVYKVNTDDEPELATQYDVMGIPNVVCFKGGEVYKRLVGLAPKDQVLQLFE